MATAASAQYSGAANACGTTPTALFGNSSTTGSGCSKAIACQTAYCACIGAGAPTNFVCGAFTGGHMPNCTVSAKCIATKMLCMTAASEEGCADLKDLKLSNLAIAGGQLYNASTGFKACKYEACKMLNATVSGGNCSLNFDELCASPVKYVFALLIKGKWSKFISDAAKKLGLSNALAADMSRKLRFVCIVKTLFIRSNRRRQTESNLAVTFEASGVTANNADLKAAIASAQTDKTFLTSTQSVYVAENPGESFTVVGISAGSASSAVFSKVASKVASRTTATTTTTTGTTATSTTTTTGTTATSTTGSDSSRSGAATQSLLAAVVVAVIGALLF
jgi:hypothetical protein